MARIEKESTPELPKPTGRMPTAEEIVRMMDEAVRAPEVVAEINRLAKWRRESAHNNRFFGQNIGEMVQEMEAFRQEARNYDPLPDKKLIITRQVRQAT